MGLANLKLGQTSRSVSDEEDVAAAALNSFFTGFLRGRFPRLHGRDELWPLLAKIVSRKAIDQRRHLLAEKRGGGRVLGESAMAGTSDVSSAADWPPSVIENELQADHLVTMSEECDRLMGLLPDEQMKTIARRRLEGYTNAEIARELGVIERTVERRLHLIRSLWNQDLKKSSRSTGSR